MDEWRLRDPIVSYPELLMLNGAATQAEIDVVGNDVADEIDSAVEYALKSPEPVLDEVYDDIYA